MLKALIIKLLTAVGVAGALIWLPALLNLAVAAGALILGLGVIAWGVFHVNSSLWARTLWRGTGKRVALTFDDGPDPEFTAPGSTRRQGRQGGLFLRRPEGS